MSGETKRESQNLIESKGDDDDVTMDDLSIIRNNFVNEFVNLRGLFPYAFGNYTERRRSAMRFYNRTRDDVLDVGGGSLDDLEKVLDDIVEAAEDSYRGEISLRKRRDNYQQEYIQLMVRLLDNQYNGSVDETRLLQEATEIVNDELNDIIDDYVDDFVDERTGLNLLGFELFLGNFIRDQLIGQTQAELEEGRETEEQRTERLQLPAVPVEEVDTERLQNASASLGLDFLPQRALRRIVNYTMPVVDTEMFPVTGSF